jgi:hypothetical protein
MQAVCGIAYREAAPGEGGASACTRTGSGTYRSAAEPVAMSDDAREFPEDDDRMPSDLGIVDDLLDGITLEDVKAAMSALQNPKTSPPLPAPSSGSPTSASEPPC